jgi:D-proline reductase (dithiol) PrdB
MGANAGEPHNRAMQLAIVKEALHHLVAIATPGTIVPLPYEYVARL